VIDQPDFSIILTCYREEHSIDEFHRRVSAVMQSLGRTYEIVITNDGSPDRTLEILKTIYKEDPNTKILIDFRGNFGQAAAHTAGLEAARGKALIFIDSDLQLDPEDIPKLVDAYDNGMDLVGGRRTSRYDSLSRRISSRAANLIIRTLTGTKMRDIFCCFKIINSDKIMSLGYGPHRLFRILEVMRSCPRCCEVKVAHHPRQYERSGWTYLRLIALMADGLLISIGNRFSKIKYAGWVLLPVTILIYLVTSLKSVGHYQDCRLMLFLPPLGAALVLSVCGWAGQYLYGARSAPCKSPLYVIRKKWSKYDEERPDQ
jgi:glycosyltransferase involved in cell wall biosynthesis